MHDHLVRNIAARVNKLKMFVFTLELVYGISYLTEDYSVACRHVVCRDNKKLINIFLQYINNANAVVSHICNVWSGKTLSK